MIGTEINGYRILELLGEGGMGEVYKALDVELDRLVALKFLKAEFGDDKILIQRFRDELRTLAGFNHPNITTLFTAFTSQGRPVMVMELVEGETLLCMVNRRGPIPAQVCVPMIKQALAGVGEAHRKMIIHRDLKPANLMLNRDGVVKVMDFGIAKMQNAPGLTRSHAALGTCLYMAPEQIRGSVDRRTDIYAMGVTLYELLAGRVPFQGDSEYDIQTAHIQQVPKSPDLFYPHIPKIVVDAVMRALAKEPGARFQTAEEFSFALGDGRSEIVTEVHYIPSDMPRDFAPDLAAVVGTVPARTGPESPAVMLAATPVPGPGTVPFSTPAPVAGATTFPTPVPTWQTPAPVGSTVPATVPFVPLAEPIPMPVPNRLDAILERWFGRTGRPRLTGAVVATAALMLLSVGVILIRDLMQPTPVPFHDDKASLGGGGSGSAESILSAGGGGTSGGGTSGDGTGGGGSTDGPGPSSGPDTGGHGSTSVPSAKQPADTKKSDANLQPANQHSVLAGRWMGTYERCEDSSRTQAALELSEPTPGAVSGTLLLSTSGGAVERCSLSGVFEAQQKSFSFTVPSCAGSATPSYLVAPHKSLLRLTGSELTGEIEPQDSCVTVRFRKM